jgi:outer membrane PBP1 activator LpoA protein
MQLRPALTSSIRSLLYWAVCTLATASVAAQEPAQVVEPHVAVILPLQSTSFGRHADSVRLGVLAAAGADQGPTSRVHVYATTEDPQQILSAYQRSLSLGAKAVIGPLTRNGVTALVHSGIVGVPTLALNVPEGEALLPRNLYVFGLQLEAEARQAAQLAFQQRARRMFVVAGETALDSRITQAFLAEWAELKGELAGQYLYTTEAAGLAKLREQLAATKADAVFFTVGATRARFIRSYVGSALPIFATSQVLISATDTLGNYDLEGVRFLDMPWLLQPDHPAVLSYLRADGSAAPLDQERFYALGIDAYRLVQELLRPHRNSEPLDGVTGTITLGDAQQFQRTLVPAQFVQGTARPLGAPAR